MELQQAVDDARLAEAHWKQKHDDAKTAALTIQVSHMSIQMSIHMSIYMMLKPQWLTSQVQSHSLARHKLHSLTCQAQTPLTRQAQTPLTSQARTSLTSQARTPLTH